MAILISFDIDGTLEVGDPPGPLTMEMVKIVQDKGFLIGSCSDRPPSSQRSMWEEHQINVDFTVAKHLLAEVKSGFKADKPTTISVTGRTWTGRTHCGTGSNSCGPTKPQRKSWFLPDG